MADPIVIIGAGLAGLSAALELEVAGESCLLLDSNSHVGGKLETTLVDDAYRIDRGFQVLLPAYPELQKFENLDTELELKFFNSGARLETDEGSILIANPLQHPSHLVSTALGRYSSLRDKVLVLKLQRELQLADPATLLTSATGTTLDYLRAYGFSEQMIGVFWAPFFSGIFLESKLNTAAGFFRYLTHMFAASPVAVPKLGMNELPRWMSQKLKTSEIKLSTYVKNVNGTSVELKNGQKIKARAVITETSGAAGSENENQGSVTSYWFKSAEAPFEGAWLSLNSRKPAKDKFINHVAVLSNVSPDYALKGDALICVNVVGTTADLKLQAVRDEATSLYGSSVKGWGLLRTDEIKKAFPLYLNRTDFDTPSQQGAIERGRNAARRILQQM